MRKVTIDLVDGFDWHKQTVKQLSVKEPNGAQYAALGEPRILVYNADGAAYNVDQPPVIKQYIELLLDHEGGGDILPFMSLTDTMLLRNVVLDFFTASAAAVMQQKRTRSSLDSKP